MASFITAGFLVPKARKNGGRHFWAKTAFEVRAEPVDAQALLKNGNGTKALAALDRILTVPTQSSRTVTLPWGGMSLYSSHERYYRHDRADAVAATTMIVARAEAPHFKA